MGVNRKVLLFLWALILKYNLGMNKIKPSKVYIIGGTGAISDSIKEQVKSTTNITDKNVVRISGQDRYETSINIAKHFDLNGDVTFALGENFPDALAESVYYVSLVGIHLGNDRMIHSPRAGEKIKITNIHRTYA